jgi:hypothetical protein
MLLRFTLKNGADHAMGAVFVWADCRCLGGFSLLLTLIVVNQDLCHFRT